MKKKTASLSILVPVFNERYLVEESLGRLTALAKDGNISKVQVIVVDDCSRDDSASIVEAFIRRQARRGKLRWEFLRHTRNQGKGAAIRSALARAVEDVTIIHDADLEYHPEDISGLMVPFIEDHADAVFGSRFQAKRFRRVLHFRHELGNRLLTFTCNLLSDYNLSDMETCYKAIRTELFQSIPIESNDFRFEPEITLKLSKRNARLFEVPISYSGRTYQEGKKIGWRDGFKALGAIVHFAMSDRIFVEENFGLENLKRLASARNFTDFLAGLLRPHVGQTVLELDAASGHLTQALVPRRRYVVSDPHPIHRFNLRSLALNKPYLSVANADLEQGLKEYRGQFDTVLAVNVLEHEEDDAAAIRAMARALCAGGKLVATVPAGPWLMGSLDAVFGHRRRYTKEALSSLVQGADLEIELLRGYGRFSSLGWWLNGRVFRKKTFSHSMLLVLNWLMPVLGRIDAFLPLPPQSLLLVAKKKNPSS
ncbi:MAG TPA: glycosyltransferase [bacterium]|jgi:glycosyltransferase involved in cell wall biosynthesis|nr:glycosyltransferase [bacterium]